jgi:CheY-like chemotaxis protein
MGDFLPVVVLSADGSEDRKVEALGEGADDYGDALPQGVRLPHQAETP